VDQSLFAVIMEAYLHGTSTRKVDDLVKALGADSGISKSEVSRICADLDTEIAAFRDRSLAGMAFLFPNPGALLRLAGAVLVEAHDEWQAGERRYLSEGSMTLLAGPPATPGGGSHTRTAHSIVRTIPLTATR
jgi:hypothetical protein